MPATLNETHAKCVRIFRSNGYRCDVLHNEEVVITPIPIRGFYMGEPERFHSMIRAVDAYRKYCDQPSFGNLYL